MKTIKLLTIAFLSILILNPALAQDDDDNDKWRKKNLGTRHDFSIDLGINNWLEDGEFPNDENALYAVRPWGSWYVGLNAINDTHVAGPLHLEWGVGVSWYNWKFENEATRLEEGDDIIIFSEAPEEVDAKKSKLTAAYLNASLVPVLKLGNGKRTRRHRWGNFEPFENKGGFRIGAGGYAGYKLASYTKTVVDDRNRDKDHDGFYLNNLRYGVRVQLGFRGVDFFANYDLNEVFVENKGPELNAFSFGVIL
ncbi:MAG: hypothetical protein RLO81_10090 [Fulvivirga sp.]|uniref:hypothetical protein n=1 Tax=Fulvivirga sp. TaxID=1931237 RepID=UPI0032EC9D6F